MVTRNVSSDVRDSFRRLAACKNRGDVSSAKIAKDAYFSRIPPGGKRGEKDVPRARCRVRERANVDSGEFSGKHSQILGRRRRRISQRLRPQSRDKDSSAVRKSCER